MCAGIGKSTALKVLAGKLKPNLGRFEARSLVGSAVQFKHLLRKHMHIMLACLI